MIKTHAGTLTRVLFYQKKVQRIIYFYFCFVICTNVEARNYIKSYNFECNLFSVKLFNIPLL